MMQKLPGFTGHLIAYCRILCILKYYRIIFQNQQLTTAMIRSGYILIIFLFANALVLQVIGQLPSYHVQFFDETTGIRSGNFQNIDMIKDQDNFLWILQTTTVQRFDGKRVDDYSFNENLASILCDVRGIIWVTTEKKVYRFHQKTKKFETVFSVGPKESIGKVFQFQDTAVWLNTSSGFFEFDQQHQSFRRILEDVPESHNIYIRNFVWFNNVLFFQHFDTLYSYNIKTRVKKGLRKDPGVYLFSLSEDRVISTSWAYHSSWYDFEKKETYPVLIPSLQINGGIYIKDVKQLDDGIFIIGGRQGIFEYNLNQDRFQKLLFYQAGRPLTNDVMILRIYIDAEKTVWLGFPEGIAHYNHFHETIGLMRNNDLDKINSWSNNAANFVEDEKGNIWFVNGNGFAKWEIATNSITSFPPVAEATDRLSHLSVRGIVYDGKYLILGPTDRGIWLYEPKTKTFQRPVYPAGEEGEKIKFASERDFVDQIRTLHNGNHVIAGRDALYLLDGKTYRLEFINCAASKENSNVVFQDGNKKIWIGTNTGLHCFDSTMHSLFHKKGAIGTLRSITKWNNNEILVAGSLGIFRVAVRSDTIYTESFHPYFNNIKVNLVYKDRNGKVWAGTSQGLYRVDSSTKKIELFDYANNVQGNGFFEDASFRSKTGLLFLGGVNGINYFIPEKIPPLDPFLKVSIQKIRVNDNDSSYSSASSFRLDPGQRSVEIGFAAPYFFNANKVKYRYRLEGYNDEWKNIGGNTSVLFTSLPAGEFIFHVAASIDNVNWFESNEKISFSIKLSFWKSWWFIVLLLLISAAVMYTIYRYKLYKRLEVERFRLRVSRDLHDDIGSTLSSINILAKSSLSRRSGEQEDDNLLHKIQRQSQKMLDAMDDLVWNTKPGHDSVESLTVRIREYGSEVLEASAISFTLDCPEALNNMKLTMEQRKNIYLIFKEALNNLAKYSCSTHAKIDFQSAKNLLIMTIHDDGVGVSKLAGRNGNGLENMKARAAEMKARLDIISYKGSGTTIRLELPV